MIKNCKLVYSVIKLVIPENEAYSADQIWRSSSRNSIEFQLIFGENITIFKHFFFPMHSLHISMDWIPEILCFHWFFLSMHLIFNVLSHTSYKYFQSDLAIISRILNSYWTILPSLKNIFFFCKCYPSSLTPEQPFYS